MLRGTHAWATNPGAWRWTGLLLLAYACVAAVAAVAASVRLFSSRRRRAGWAYGGIAVSLFAIWTAAVNYSSVLGLVAAGIAAPAIWAAPIVQRTPTVSTEPARTSGPTRVLTITAATLVIAFWVIAALFWFVFRDGDNYCGCWADQPNAWQYTAEIVVALVGSLGIGVAAGAWLRHNPTVLVVGSIIAGCALGGVDCPLHIGHPALTSQPCSRHVARRQRRDASARAGLDWMPAGRAAIGRHRACGSALFVSPQKLRARTDHDSSSPRPRPNDPSASPVA